MQLADYSIQPDQTPTMTVSQFVQYINEIVSYAPVIIEGEVSNLRRIAGRNFCYFDIKDDASVAHCFQGFWHCKTEITNGSKIRIFGNPALFKNGSLVIDIKSIALMGKGQILEAYTKLKIQLEKEGLFDLKHKKALPAFPKTVGLIAGKNSSAFFDVTAEIKERWGAVKIFFFPTRVQGLYAVKEVTKAIKYFNERLPVDVLIIARGGGSLEELQAFSTQEVARAIFASKLPIVSAIGHEDHWTLADFVSDMRAKTPTKAAQLVVPDKEEVRNHFLNQLNQMQRAIQNSLKQKEQTFKRLEQTVGHCLRGILEKEKQFLIVNQDFLSNKISILFLNQKAMLEQARVKLEMLDPEKVLSRGYAVIEKADKRVFSIKELKVGEKILARLQDGQFVATIRKK